MQPIFGLSNRSAARAVTSAGQYCAPGGGSGEQLRIYNAGPNDVCILAGDGTQTAAFPTDSATAANGAGVVIGAGIIEIFSCPLLVNLHLICAAGNTATVYCSRGNGQ